MNGTKTAQKFVIVHDLLISVTCAGTADDGMPSPADTGKLLDAFKTAPITRVLAAGIGNVSSSSMERKQGAELLKKRKIRTAIVTDNALVRGIVTAVAWLGADTSAFSWAERRNALQYLGMMGVMADQAFDTLARLRTEVELLQTK